MQELNASVDTLSAYYMGFYIHSCPKMRYKGKLQPSFLLCPETYTWHALNDEVRRKLDKSKYSRLHPDPNAQDAHKFDATVDLDGVYLLTNYRNAQTYGVYKSVSIHFTHLETLCHLFHIRLFVADKRRCINETTTKYYRIRTTDWKCIDKSTIVYCLTISMTHVNKCGRSLS